jgi:hypothetical protein
MISLGFVCGCGRQESGRVSAGAADPPPQANDRPAPPEGVTAVPSERQIRFKNIFFTKISYHQERSDVIALLGPPETLGEIEKRGFWTPMGSLEAMNVVHNDFWFDGEEAWCVRYARVEGKLVACQWGRAKRVR